MTLLELKQYLAALPADLNTKEVHLVVPAGDHSFRRVDAHLEDCAWYPKERQLAEMPLVDDDDAKGVVLKMLVFR